MEQWLSRQNEFVFFLVLLALLMIAAEVGFRVGARRHAADDTVPHVDVSSIQGAVLGLLALLLGFSFAMAADRFQTRKDLLRDEVNAIGTVSLRIQLVPEPQRSALTALVRKYVDTRVELQTDGYRPEMLRDVGTRAAALQTQMWTEAVAAAERQPQSVMLGLFINALNDMIDMDGKQVAAIRNRIPTPIFLLLFLVAFIAVGITGYASAQNHRESAVLSILMSLLIAGVILLVVDLHRPARGLMTIDLSSLTALRDSLPATGR